MTCRLCGASAGRLVIDLGRTPLANSYLAESDLTRPEPRYPLKVFLCDGCHLVQIESVESPDHIFSEYAYFSSYSNALVESARAFVARAVERFALGPDSLIVEVASNDGYLLQHVIARGIRALGIEPAANVAEAARAKGIRTIVHFLGEDTAREVVREHGPADLVIANNVFAHVPDPIDFARGLRTLVRPRGAVSVEFPHLLRLIEESQYDTIYHEHLSYFSLVTAERIFEAGGLRVFDVEEIDTHGGSLRVYAGHPDAERMPSVALEGIRARETEAGLQRVECYDRFREAVERSREALRRFLSAASEQGRLVVGYGAPAKANTLLNYCGIGPDLVRFTVDRSPAKQGRYLPGSRIPIHPPARLLDARPDYVLILPWNLREEVVAQLPEVRSWGGRFVTPIPEVRILD